MVPDKIQAFAEYVEAYEIAMLRHNKMDCEANIANCKTTVKSGKKYTRVDVGHSGRYMVENETGNIFGIKAYGVIHRGHPYGTLASPKIDTAWGKLPANLVPPYNRELAVCRPVILIPGTI